MSLIIYFLRHGETTASQTGGYCGTLDPDLTRSGYQMAKDIRWSVLQPEFDAEKFRLAVVKGQDPDGPQLKPDMPRWNISKDDLADLITFLKTLP